MLKYTTCAKKVDFAIGFRPYNNVINIIRTIILLITFIKIVLTRNFLAHAVTFGDLMTGNFLAGDFLGGYQIAHIWLVKLMISVQHGWMLEIF